MKKLKIAVIGCGRISSVYQEVFKELDEMIEVIFAVDKDVDRAKIFAANFQGCGYSVSLDDLIALKPDVVHILTPHFLHKVQAIDCLKAGCNVLTEKPIATTLSDANAMCEVAKQVDKKLGVIFQNRYIPGIQEAKRLIEKGELGKITGAYSTLNWWRPPSYYECDWKGSWEKEGGGVVIDQAIHSIDLVRYLIGCDVETIQANIDTRVLIQIEVEDVADAVIKFKNGAVYSFFACNYYTRNSPIRIEINGEDGTVILNGDTVTITSKKQELTIMPSKNIESAGKEYWGNYHYSQIKEFYNCVINDKDVVISPEDATKTLEIVLGIYESAKKGKKNVY